MVNTLIYELFPNVYDSGASILPTPLMTLTLLCVTGWTHNTASVPPPPTHSQSHCSQPDTLKHTLYQSANEFTMETICVSVCSVGVYQCYGDSQFAVTLWGQKVKLLSSR